ncbi:MAG: hypothetical protein ACI8W7_003020 [Gammaproteobacteria bacterium]
MNIDNSVVNYARTKGVFVSMQLGNSALTYDKGASIKAYGEEPDPADMLFSELAVSAIWLASRPSSPSLHHRRVKRSPLITGGVQQLFAA